MKNVRAAVREWSKHKFGKAEDEIRKQKRKPKSGKRMQDNEHWLIKNCSVGWIVDVGG